ncbi:hypothetical protein DFQ28_005948 [Apophysomyces sp. BC1034]|nr:hypothetical protein DFQ30_006255 [Apophysomyces sp. BC1015]KAG0171287.1 hypothetical protein DFQ29_008914 [Apophysomyces sp. BC1021]KAG0187706.1 hypothetical protein DFQ28_005948 [Apophysomyces sp. BC1034]
MNVTTAADSYHHQQHFLTKPNTPNMPDYPLPQRSNTTSRRTSMVLPASLLSRNKSTKSARTDRRRSSGTLSTHSASQKARKCIGEYYVGKTLGKGASGRVKLGTHKHTGEQVAIKIISKAHLANNPAIEKAVRREIAIMKLIRHPNVMALVDVIDDASSPDLHLILEYVEGGELFEYLVSKGKLNETEARHHFQQIILGLDFCHHHLICHRDLKPENLLLDSKNNIKIADFGMASLQPAGSMLETSCGSPHYASPEIVAGMPYNGSASDIWSCGVILYALLTGHLPFDDENIRQLLKKVKSGKYAMPDDISRNAQDLIRRILVVDPSKRLTMEQIMSHPWFCETEPENIANLPVPPTENEIGRPVTDPSEIDDRFLETIKFLWGETRDDVIIRALISKEHNMQKVVYVLLQQHAERYWQMDHDEDEHDYPIKQYDMSDAQHRRFRTVGHCRDRDRRCMSMVDQDKSYDRPVAPWMADPEPKVVARRFSAATIRTGSHHHHQNYDLMPPVPPVPIVSRTKDEASLKKSETFYARFKSAISPSRRQSKEKVQTPTTPTTPTTPQPQSTSSSAFGTLRRKNPFAKSEPTTPVPPPRSSLRPTGNLLQRNKVDPTSGMRKSTSSSNSRQTNPKRLSIRVPNAFQTEKSSSGKKFGFTLNSISRRQRKQIDLSVFQPQQEDDAKLSPPPALSDGSTLSSSSSSNSSRSSTSSNNNSSSCAPPPTFKTALQTMPPSPNLLTPPPSAKDITSDRRSSNGSFQSIDRRGSNQSTYNRPATPSLLSNSSTITTNSGSYPPSPAEASAPKTSWLSNLFFFKQPKVCSLVVNTAKTADIVRTMQSVLNESAETRIYEKHDKYGAARYKIEIRSHPEGGKIRQVKCRVDFVTTIEQAQTSVVQFTQQQGDAMLLASIVRQLHTAMEKEYPPSAATTTA